MLNEGPPLARELEGLLNQYNRENLSDTPDFILAQFVMASLEAFETATRRRSAWYNHNPWSALESPLTWPIRLRRWLLVPGNRRWNAWVRDFTAWLEHR